MKKQYESGHIIWISPDHIVYLKNSGIEFLDYSFDKLWDLSFDEMKTGTVLSCMDHGGFLFVVAEEGKLLKIDKENGYIVKELQNPFQGNFRQNYFFRKDGQLIFLGHNLYLEISADTLEIQKLVNLEQEDIRVKDCYFDENNELIYFYGTYGDSFPNLIGGFDISTASFFWKYIMESEGKGNRFYNSPVPVGGFIAVGDFLDNVYVFEKE